ncbi:MAG: hypothetical protein NT086_01945 [Proteobacteria bacterium]|nr:hypothetical protein [Pseudomonadota bacterium]
MRKLVRSLAPALSGQALIISILRKYGGSLYVADPNYCYINSDGTNQCAIDTPVGYVQDLCGSKSITQPTSSAKPILKKVPTKLGPELVPNGDFSGPLGPQWNTPAGYSIANGQLVIGAAAVQWGGIVNAAVPPPVIGKSYQLSSTLVSGSSNDAALRYGNGVVPIGKTGTFTCQGLGWGQIMPSAANGTANSVVDNASIREVIEWGWAWEFDGADDYFDMSNVGGSLVNSPYTVVDAAAYRQSGYQGGRSNGTNTNLHLGLRPTGVLTVGQWGNDTNSVETYSANERLIYAARKSSVNSSLRITSSRLGLKNTPSPNNTFLVSNESWQMGALSAATAEGSGGASVTMFARAVCPSAIPDAELEVIERYFAQLSGVTLP